MDSRYLHNTHGIKANEEKMENHVNTFNDILDWNLFPKELMPQKKKTRAKAGILKLHMHATKFQWTTIRIKTKRFNPTGTKKKTVKPSRKDTEDMLNKLDVSFSSRVCSMFNY